MRSLRVKVSTHSGWMFVLLWYVASFVGGLLYFLPVSAVHFVLRLDEYADVLRVASANRAFMVFATSAVAAACGLSIGFFQWLVLRREFKRIRGWILATTLGFASLGPLPLVAELWQPGWVAWAFTLILNGKFQWLARLVPDWPLASWLPGAVTLTLFGLVLGLFQWMVLRAHVKRAAYWIIISTAGWAASAISCLYQDSFWNVFTTWDLPFLITGLGLAWLRPRDTSGEQG